MLEYGALVLDKICIGYEVIDDEPPIDYTDFTKHQDWIDMYNKGQEDELCDRIRKFARRGFRFKPVFIRIRDYENKRYVISVEDKLYKEQIKGYNRELADEILSVLHRNTCRNIAGQVINIHFNLTDDKSLEDLLDDCVTGYVGNLMSFLSKTKGSKAEVDVNGYSVIDDKTFIVKTPKGYVKVKADCVLPMKYLDAYFMMMRTNENLPKPFALHFSKYTFN